MFDDALELKLKLTIDGNSFDIPGGNVKSFKVDLHAYGFTADASFVVSSEKAVDDLFRAFTKRDLMEAKLEISPHFKPKDSKMEPLSLQGLVTRKAILVERTFEDIHIRGNPVLYRHYSISFADPAQVLWQQHFPCSLMVDKSLKDLIDENKGSRVDISYDADALEREYAINALPLGVDGNEASFYDFVLWLADSLNCIWAYDSKENSYALASKKSSDGESASLNKTDIKDHRIELPETVRSSARVLNADSETPLIEEISHDQAVRGVYHDYIDAFPSASEFEDRSNLEDDRQKLRGHEIHLEFERYPAMTYRPGRLVKLEGNLWSDKIFPKGKTYRVRDIAIDAHPVNEELTSDHNMPHARYRIEMHSQLEREGEKWVSLPPFKAPGFPLYVEGKVITEEGGVGSCAQVVKKVRKALAQEGEGKGGEAMPTPPEMPQLPSMPGGEAGGSEEEGPEIYRLFQSATAAGDQYKVRIPLWGGIEIIVPFQPDFFSGHFYFPAYNNARVLVAIDFHSARIERFLEWRTGARMPVDTQGNHLLMGKTTSSKTSISHSYLDAKPVLSVQRTSDKDVELIRLAEGSLILETKEEEES